MDCCSAMQTLKAATSFAHASASLIQASIMSIASVGADTVARAWASQGPSSPPPFSARRTISGGLRIRAAIVWKLSRVGCTYESIKSRRAKRNAPMPDVERFDHMDATRSLARLPPLGGRDHAA